MKHGSLNAQRSLEWTLYTFRFIEDNFLTILGLGLIAALGRAVQLQALGPISPIVHTLLEILIEATRVMLVVYVLGMANIKRGFAKIIQVVSNKESRRRNWQVAITKLGQQWLTVLINLVAFLIIACLFNYLIDHIAYKTCLYVTLLARHLISHQSSEWVLILFFKNLSVIPFTLIFQALFVLWITNQLPTRRAIPISDDQ